MPPTGEMLEQHLANTIDVASQSPSTGRSHADLGDSEVLLDIPAAATHLAGVIRLYELVNDPFASRPQSCGIS